MTAPGVQWCEIDEDLAGQRIDNYLIARLKGVPKSLIYRILRKGEVRVNKGRIKPDYKLAIGDLVRIPPVKVSADKHIVQPSQRLISLLDNAIAYEDEHMLVVNKPSGLAVHGGSGVQLGLIESLRKIRGEHSFLELVHRLDRDTSGCVMIAKSRRSLRYLQHLLREGEISKVYRALVLGSWPKRRQHVTVALRKNHLASGERVVVAVADDAKGAKRSRTEYRVLERYCGCSLVETKPITGRTHQIRVHSQYVGHPILGDDKYASAQAHQFARQIGLKRLFLHALILEFIAPDGKPVKIEAPLSEELSTVIHALQTIKQTIKD
ncbi:MAG: 23S rRNA pseudouridine(955/2504/2580) synthase RluC [Pseudomonadota bacterium]